MIPEAFLRPALLLLTALLIFGGGFTTGSLYISGKWRSAEAGRAAEAVKLVTRQGQVTERVVTKYRDRIVEVKGETQTVEKLIPQFIPPAADPQLPLGWRLLHDAGAAGSVPDPARVSNAATPDALASAAVKTVVENYGVCRETSAQLEALQNWVREQAK